MISNLIEMHRKKLMNAIKTRQFGEKNEFTQFQEWDFSLAIDLSMSMQKIFGIENLKKCQILLLFNLTNSNYLIIYLLINFLI